VAPWFSEARGSLPKATGLQEILLFATYWFQACCVCLVKFSFVGNFEQELSFGGAAPVGIFQLSGIGRHGDVTISK
jgi:hypothetical protein